MTERKTTPESWQAWRWPIAAVVAVAILCATGLWIFEASRRSAERAAGAAGRLAKEVAQEAKGIAEGFRSGHITQTFLSALPRIGGDGSGRLEVAALTATERFERSDERRLLWDLVAVGTTVVEIEAPVTYRYHLRFDDKWQLEVDGQRVIVRAPALQPTLPPALHTQGLRKRTQEGWLRFDAEDQMLALERSITPTLVQYAKDERRLALVRDEARRTVARFVRSWLLAEDQWREDRYRSVTVVFADEDPGDAHLPGPLVLLPEPTDP